MAVVIVEVAAVDALARVAVQILHGAKLDQGARLAEATEVNVRRHQRDGRTRTTGRARSPHTVISLVAVGRGDFSSSPTGRS